MVALIEVDGQEEVVLVQVLAAALGVWGGQAAGCLDQEADLGPRVPQHQSQHGPEPGLALGPERGVRPQVYLPRQPASATLLDIMLI